MFELKMYKEVIFDSDSKFEKGSTCDLKNDMRNLANLHKSTRKCQIWVFNGILVSKVENVSA